jgi:methyl-accepting chemotaxis protein
MWLVASLALAGMGGILLHVHNAMETSARETHARVDDLSVLTQMNVDLVRFTLAAMDSIIDREEGRISQERLTLITELSMRLTEGAKRTQAVADTPEERAVLVDLTKDTGALVALIRDDMRKAIEAKAPKEDFERLDDAIDGTSEKIEKPLAYVEASLRREMDVAYQQEERVSSAALRNGIISFSVSLVLLASLSLLIGGSIIKPMRRLTLCMNAMAGGNTGQETPGRAAQDEIGEMARAVEVFREGLIRADRLTSEQEENKQHFEQERRNGLSLLADQFEQQVKGVTGTVSKSSIHMKATAESLADGSDECGRTVAALSSAAQLTSGNVETVAAAAEELTASISEISRQVATSASVAGNAATDAQRVKDLAVDLAEAAQRIGDVVGLINDIASQTNLLALNATIEAARAGEAGKGFAVVAGEVKTLANQTAKATDEITTQVGEVQLASKGVVDAITGISGTIEQLSAIASGVASAVEEQGAATAEIARNVQEAATGTAEVSRNVQRMTEVVQNVSVGASQVLQAAIDLSDNSGTLTGQVDAFLSRVRAG